jgi:hypothetical protein
MISVKSETMMGMQNWPTYDFGAVLKVQRAAEKVNKDMMPAMLGRLTHADATLIARAFESCIVL